MTRTHSLPMVIGADHKVRRLQRLARAHSEFDEAFLQELLAKYPELLPVHELREDAGELLCIGREVRAAKGVSIDNLYLSTGGYVVVVETKLWRSPEARREVLSQVLDYVKEVVTKDYEWLEAQWRSYAATCGCAGTPLLGRLGELAADEIDESTYVDRVNRALKRGDVLALIVGDGIQTGLQELVAHLCRDSPHLRYGLALVELACHHLDEGNERPLLVVPRIVHDVEPVQRAYVRIEMAPELAGQVHVTPEIEKEEDRHKPTRRVNLSEQEFVAALEKSVGHELCVKTEDFYKDLIKTFELEPDFKAAAVMLKVPDPNGEKPGASVLAIEREGRIYNTDHMSRQLRRWGLPSNVVKRLCGDYWRALHEIEPGFRLDGITHVQPNAFIPLNRVEDKLPAIRAAVGAIVDAINSAAETSM